jgi:VIT1/CCC1 family predicted Fe2+/Mn2+ transporter
VGGAATLGLILFGGSGAWLGGASVPKGALRVLLGGWLAMALTYGIGACAWSRAPAREGVKVGPAAMV